MKIFSSTTNINFLGVRVPMAVLAATFMIVSAVSLTARWLNLGLDFTGGTIVEIRFERPAELNMVRDILANAGFSGAVVQHIGTQRDVLVRFASREGQTSAELSTAAMSALRGGIHGAMEMRRVEYVGSQIGQELTEQGGLAMLYALLGILIYVWIRFEWRLAVSAVLTTLHDTVFTLGYFSLLQLEFDLTVLAALLAIIGYSLNDTIVVFDRLRENFRIMRKASSVEVMNSALNQTLSRTIMTSGTTLIVVIALFIYGGAVIHNFALALLVGIVVGTFSSIYIACPLVLWLGVNRVNLTPVKKEGAADDRP